MYHSRSAGLSDVWPSIGFLTISSLKWSTTAAMANAPPEPFVQTRLRHCWLLSVFPESVRPLSAVVAPLVTGITPGLKAGKLEHCAGPPRGRKSARRSGPRGRRRVRQFGGGEAGREIPRTGHPTASVGRGLGEARCRAHRHLGLPPPLLPARCCQGRCRARASGSRRRGRAEAEKAPRGAASRRSSATDADLGRIWCFGASTQGVEHIGEGSGGSGGGGVSFGLSGLSLYAFGNRVDVRARRAPEIPAGAERGAASTDRSARATRCRDS